MLFWNYQQKLPLAPRHPPLNVPFARSKMLIIVECEGVGKRVYYSNLFENLKTFTIKAHFFSSKVILSLGRSFLESYLSDDAHLGSKD